MRGPILAKAAFVLGSLGLLCAMASDALAVLGRHLGLPLRGSIELVESSIVLMACASLVGTTLERGHASVHLLTERLPARARRVLASAANLAGALFFAWLLLGSALVLADLWHGAEQTELLGIPIAPLRVLWCATAAAIALAFGAQALAGRRAA